MSVELAERARRVNAALVEVGHPDGAARVHQGGILIASAVPFVDAWRAVQSAGPAPDGRWRCRRCAHATQFCESAEEARAKVPCEAFAPFTEDCGVTR